MLLGVSTAASCNHPVPELLYLRHGPIPVCAPTHLSQVLPHSLSPCHGAPSSCCPKEQPEPREGLVPTFQLGHGGISQAGLAERRRCLLALPPARGILAARQRVPHVGVGDKDGQAGIGQRDKDGLQGPAARAQRGPCARPPCPLQPSAIQVRPRGRQLLPLQRQSPRGLGFHSSISLPPSY